MRLGFRTVQILWLAVKEAWPVLLTAGGVLSSWGFGYLLSFLTLPYLPIQVRYTGVLLETFGFVLVAIGIRQTRQLFDRPSLIARFRDWCKLLANAFSAPTAHNLSASVGGTATITGELSLKLGVPENASVEQRLDVLEKNLDILRTDFEKRIQRFQTKLAETDQAVDDEVTHRTAAIETSRPLAAFSENLDWFYSRKKSASPLDSTQCREHILRQDTIQN